MRLALRTALAAALVLAAGTGIASADSTPPAGSVPPDQDPFYAAPANIGTYQPGQIVASRQISPKLYGQPVTTVNAWQLSYRTNDSHNQPELTVTTLLVPTKAWTGTGPRPAVSVQSAEDSTGT